MGRTSTDSWVIDRDLVEDLASDARLESYELREQLGCEDLYDGINRRGDFAEFRLCGALV